MASTLNVYCLKHRVVLSRQSMKRDKITVANIIMTRIRIETTMTLMACFVSIE